MSIKLNENYSSILAEFTQWLERINYSKGSVRSRTRHLKRFLVWVSERGIKNLEELSNQDLRDYNQYLHHQPIKAKTIEAHISGLKIFNEYRESYGESPILKTKLRVDKEIRFERVILTKQEINRMYEACEDNPFGWRDRAILAIFYGCGLRCREGMHLEQKDIDFNTNLVHVRKGKNYRERYVPMSPGVTRELKNWIENYHPIFSEKTNIIIPSRNGKTLKGGALNNRLKKLTKAADIDKHITLHCLRHSIATHLSQSGMDLESVSHFLGHQSLETTKKYAQIIQEI